MYDVVPFHLHIFPIVIRLLASFVVVVLNKTLDSTFLATSQVTRIILF